jgi:hypothetical protein
MRHQNSVFHALLKHVAWSFFDASVAERGADFRTRRLSTRSQLIALLYGQFSGASSLREIEAGLASHQARLYHIGAHGASRSTLADANAKRPHQVFWGLFRHMLGQAHRRLRKGLGEAVHLIDATGLRLSGLSQWARFSANVCGVKLHVVYDPDADQPLYAALTPARVNDISVAKEMPIVPGVTYAFDLGYYDYAWWAKLDAAGCRIVTRLKKNTRLNVLERVPLDPDSPVLSDCIGHLPERLARNRKNPFQNPVREVQVRTETGKLLRILTNDLDSPAEEIAALYKRRWQIELFFRCIKQTLKIRHFLGTSENAVRIQIAIALIAFLILRLAQLATAILRSPLAFARLVRVNIMHRKPLDGLFRPPQPIPIDPNQLALDLNAS